MKYNSYPAARAVVDVYKQEMTLDFIIGELRKCSREWGEPLSENQALRIVAEILLDPTTKGKS